MNEMTCQHHAHHNGVHEFVLHAASAEVVDTLFAHLDALVSDTRPGEPIRILIDTSRTGGVQPFARITLQMQQFVRRYPNRTLYRYTRIALVNRSVFSAMIESFLGMLNLGLSVERFTPEQRHEAFDWLLQPFTESPIVSY